MKILRYGAILKVLGVLLCIIAFSMVLCIPFSIYYETSHLSDFVSSILICLFGGIVLLSAARKMDQTVTKREGYLIVFLAWITLWIACALPYLLSGNMTSITDAFFETMSGLTTTGSTVVNDIEMLPRDILFWRSFTQWLGGMGIIVLTVALLPLLGIGGIELFVAEAPGPTSEKLHPRIKDTAKSLWFIYLGLTLILWLILWLLGMDWFDGINHALTTMATGGFSTKNASVAYFSPQIQYVIALFMFLGGVNYSLYYLTLRRKFSSVWSSDELRYYCFLIIGVVLAVTLLVFTSADITIEQAFRDSLFQVISVVTTTGFVTADYTSWSPVLTTIFFILLFLGACAGSTSGGIKIIRHTVLFRNSILEFKRLLHPRAMIRLRLNGKIVPPRVLTHILVFFVLYIGTFAIGTVLVVLTGVDLITAAGAVATSIGNVGPGIGEVGPVNSYAPLSDITKWILAWLMLIGRLELFTVLIIFTPYFWINH